MNQPRRKKHIEEGYRSLQPKRLRVWSFRVLTRLKSLKVILIHLWTVVKVSTTSLNTFDTQAEVDV